jgi:hypothetical protein
MNTKHYLDGEIARIYNEMSKLDPTTDEYGKLESKWTELLVQKLEFEKHEASVTQNEKQIIENRKDRVGRTIMDGFKVVLPLGTAVVMTLLAYTFEAKGVIPVGIGKKWADKITKY